MRSASSRTVAAAVRELAERDALLCPRLVQLVLSSLFEVWLHMTPSARKLPGYRTHTFQIRKLIVQADLRRNWDLLRTLRYVLLRIEGVGRVFGRQDVSGGALHDREDGKGGLYSGSQDGR